MKVRAVWPVSGVFLAIGVTTAMDAAGLSPYSALPLLPITLLLWFLQRLPRSAVGLRPGRPGDYLLALLHPLFVIGVLTAIVTGTGLASPEGVSWKRVLITMLINSAAGALAVLLTEEGFFRGWLWASLRAGGFSESATLLWSSAAFAAWHISAVTLETGFNPPAAQVPLFLVNAFVMGTIWGLLRALSGSVLVPSVCHSIWNAVAYSLYGFGSKAGALGVEETSVFSPELGVAGLALNVVFGAALYYRWKTGSRPGK